MISVADIDQIAAARLEDAKVLFASSRYDGAVYMCGYAVELALKARICRTLNWPSFPSTRKEFEGYSSFRTHDLEVLLRLSGQEARIKQEHFRLWNTVARWNPEARYKNIGSATNADAASMINAAERLRQVL